MSASSVERVVGASVKRTEDDRILSGRGRYIDDIRLPGMAHAVFLRSSVPHAVVAAIHVEAALAVPGVLTVLTGAELADLIQPLQVAAEAPGAYPDAARPFYTALATDRVRHIGDPIAVVVAESRRIAEDGRDAIVVDLDPLEPVVSLEHARDPARPKLFDELESNMLYDETAEFGDPDVASAAMRVVRATLRPQRIAHTPMEVRGGIAEHDAGTGELVYHAATQAPQALRLDLVAALRHPADKLRVITPDVGGGFGQKVGMFREDPVVCAASKLLGRPVKWIEDRVENLISAPQSRSEVIEIAASVTEDGKICSLEVDAELDLGAYPALPFGAGFNGALIRTTIPGPYAIRHLRWRQSAFASNRASNITYRGPWAAAPLAREVIIEQIARELDLEPFEVRRRNLVSEDEQPSTMITGPTLEGVRTLEGLERAAELADLATFRAEQRAAREQGRLLGIGFATVLEPAPGPPDFHPSLGFHVPGERAVARLEVDGRLTLITAQSPHGQSHETTIAQVAASELGVPLDHVRVVHGDTEQTPFNMMGTSASRGAALGGGSALHATRLLKLKALETAAYMLGMPSDGLEIVDGIVVPKGGTDGLPLSAVAMASYFGGTPGEEHGLRSSAVYEEPPGGWTIHFHTSVVEVDPMTGQVALLRHLAVVDCGEQINPAIVDGQIRGATAQGIGIALYENALYDDEANFLAGTFGNYLVPTATEIPSIEIEHLASIPAADESYRGVSNGGTVAAPPAIINAVADAIGVWITTLPLTPERVLDALDTRGSGA